MQSELLSRRLGYYCCRKLSSLFNDQLNKNHDPKSQDQLKQQQQQHQQKRLSGGLNIVPPPPTPPPTTSLDLSVVKKDNTLTPTKQSKPQKNFKVFFSQYLF